MNSTNSTYLDAKKFILKHKIPHVVINSSSRVSSTHGVPCEYNEWYSENEDDLLDIWYNINSIVSDRGLNMLDTCRFNHFCSFVSSRTTMECFQDQLQDTEN